VSEKKLFKWVNIWQSYKQERGYLMHFMHLANTLQKDKKNYENTRQKLSQ